MHFRSKKKYAKFIIIIKLLSIYYFYLETIFIFHFPKPIKFFSSRFRSNHSINQVNTPRNHQSSNLKPSENNLKSRLMNFNI